MQTEGPGLVLLLLGPAQHYFQDKGANRFDGRTTARGYLVLA